VEIRVLILTLSLFEWGSVIIRHILAKNDQRKLKSGRICVRKLQWKVLYDAGSQSMKNGLNNLPVSNNQ
jgi:hypothetical protein